MLDFRVHVYNEEVWMDDNVFIDIKLPAVPHQGDIVTLSFEQRSELLDMAIKSLEVARNYASTWCYGASHDVTYNTFTKDNLEDMCFDDIMTVDSLRYNPNSPIIDIELK